MFTDGDSDFNGENDSHNWRQDRDREEQDAFDFTSVHSPAPLLQLQMFRLPLNNSEQA